MMLILFFTTKKNTSVHEILLRLRQQWTFFFLTARRARTNTHSKPHIINVWDAFSQSLLASQLCHPVCGVNGF